MIALHEQYFFPTNQENLLGWWAFSNKFRKESLQLADFFFSENGC